MSAPKPALHVEWQLVVVLTSGTLVVLPCDSDGDARSRGRRIVHATDGRATWRIEQRFTTDWRSVSTPLPVRVDPGAGLHRRQD